MKNETARKIAFLTLAVLLIFLVSWIIGSADFFSTAVLAVIVGVFCLDIEEYFDLLKKENHIKNSESIIENQDVQCGKVTAYILNLTRAKERWEFILPQVKALDIPYEKITAIDGKKLSEKLKKEIVDKVSFGNFFKMLPEAGTIGCSLSHEKAWRYFLESDNEFALVIEDDVKFEPKELSEVIKSAIENQFLWDIIGLELNHYGYPQKIAKLALEKFLVLYMTNVKHSGAYLINRLAAKRMLEKFYPIKMPLDHYFTRSWEFGLRFCGVKPRIVEQKFGDSQIKCDESEKFEDAKTLAANVVYNIYTAFMQTAYNFLLYLSSRCRL